MELAGDSQHVGWVRWRKLHEGGHDAQSQPAPAGDAHSVSTGRVFQDRGDSVDCQVLDAFGRARPVAVSGRSEVDVEIVDVGRVGRPVADFQGLDHGPAGEQGVVDI